VLVDTSDEWITSRHRDIQAAGYLPGESTSAWLPKQQPKCWSLTPAVERPTIESGDLGWECQKKCA